MPPPTDLPLPRAMLFDLDGTLVDSLPDLATSTNHLRRAFDLPPVTDSTVRGWIGDGALWLMRRALAERGDFAPLAERATAVFANHHAKQCTQLVRPYPGVERCLDRWRAAGCRLGCVTNKPGRFATAILDHLGLAPRLSTAVFGDTLPTKKPDAAPVRHALAELEVDAADALLVGDGVQDLRAGRAAGVRTAAVLFGFGDADRLRAEGADEFWPAFGDRRRPSGGD